MARGITSTKKGLRAAYPDDVRGALCCERSKGARISLCGFPQAGHGRDQLTERRVINLVEHVPQLVIWE
jgi:hypothetical protein